MGGSLRVCTHGVCMCVCKRVSLCESVSVYVCKWPSQIVWWLGGGWVLCLCVCLCTSMCVYI